MVEMNREMFASNLKRREILTPEFYDFRGLSAPLRVFWEITNECNLRCLHCCVDSGLPLMGELNTEEAYDVVEQLVKMKIFELTFGGGEPLVRKDIFDIAEYARDRGIKVSLMTNGMISDDETIKKIKKIFNIVQISLDGSTSKTHDTIRGVHGSFTEAISMARKLTQLNVTTWIATICTRLNYRELHAIYNLAKKLKVSSWGALKLIPAGRAVSNYKNLKLTRDEFLGVIKLLRAIERKDPTVVPDEHFYFWNHLPELINRPNFRRCQSAVSNCTIRANGDVTSCTFFTGSAGNLRRQTFAEIWHKSQLFQKWRTGKMVHKMCKKCTYLDSCKGGCFVNACEPISLETMLNSC